MKLRRLLRGDDGSAAIETALAYMLMMTCVLGIIEFSLMTYTYEVYADAARQGVRYAIVHGSDSSNCSGPTAGCTDSTAQNVVNQVTSYAAVYALPIAGTTIQVNYPDSAGSSPPSRVIVTISYTYASLFRYPGAPHVFQASAQGRILY